MFTKYRCNHHKSSFIQKKQGKPTEDFYYIKIGEKEKVRHCFLFIPDKNVTLFLF